MGRNNSNNSVVTNQKQGWRERSSRKTALAVALFLNLVAPCTGWRQQQLASTTARRSLRGGARVVYGVNRVLQQQRGTVNETDHPAATKPPESVMAPPLCATVKVPAAAGILSGSYSYSGGFSNNRPKYANDDPSNETLLFSKKEPRAGSGEATDFWFITSSEQNVTYHLSLEIDAYEPAAMYGWQSWVIINDPEACPADGGPCVLEMDITCMALTSEEPQSTSAPTSAPTAAPTIANRGTTSNSTSSPSGAEGGGYSGPRNDTEVAIATPEPSPVPTVLATASPTVASTPAHVVEPPVAPAKAPQPTAAPSPDTAAAQPMTPPTATPTAMPTATTTTTEDSWLQGCVNLDIRTGGDRTGVYLIDETTSCNNRSVYAVGGERTDVVFSMQMNACDLGWGVVNSTWAENKGELGPEATIQELFLMYASGLDLPADRCMVDVWVVTAGGAIGSGLDFASKHTFISISDLTDPTEVTSWMKYTPRQSVDERAKLEENFWIDVGCAEEDQVAAAEQSAERGSTVRASTSMATPPPRMRTSPPVPAPPAPPSGEEPNTR